MPRAHTGSFSVDYCEAGSGMPIIFIPGLTEFEESFAFQFHGLDDSYRVISYNLRRGLKRASDYTLDLLVNDLEKLLDALKLNNAVICGHSFGALVAMQFSIRHPEATNALILVSAFPSPPDVSQSRFVSWVSAADHPFHKSFGMSLKVKISQLLGARTMGAVAMQDEVSAVKTIARQALKTSATSITQRMNIIQNTDLRPSLSQVQAPTLVIAGAKDRSFFLSSAQHLYENIPDATLEVIEGGGHFCFLTRHDRFNTAVDEFLTERLAAIS